MATRLCGWELRLDVAPGSDLWRRMTTMIVAVMTKILFEALAVGQTVEPFEDLVLPLFSSPIVI